VRPDRRGVAGLLLGAAALLGVGRAPGQAGVRDVRFWSYPEYTRVVVELERLVETQVHRLPPDGRAGRPERLYLDLPDVWVGRDYADGIDVGDGLLRALRLGQNTLKTARLVIDLERYDRHRLLVLSAPPRVVVDVYGGRAAPPGAPAPRLRSAGLRPVRSVVIDPGHGGRDPGATARSGLREKDVVLRLARALRPRLEAGGLQVRLTREDDRTLELEERTAFAEGVGGDLFVSLHANAAPNRRLRGVETYYLDKSHARHTIRVAAHENGISPGELDSLQRTLAGFRISELSGHSERLARTVHGELVSGLRRRFGSLDDLGVKRGPFFVLFLSNLPSILVEVGFLTHPEEARRLGDAAYLAALADEIAQGILRYRDASLPVVAERRG
jgi:N-acetylmuramoyl-L-alanine amidase